MLDYLGAGKCSFFSSLVTIKTVASLPMTANVVLQRRQPLAFRVPRSLSVFIQSCDQNPTATYVVAAAPASSFPNGKALKTSYSNQLSSAEPSFNTFDSETINPPDFLNTQASSSAGFNLMAFEAPSSTDVKDGNNTFAVSIYPSSFARVSGSQIVVDVSWAVGLTNANLSLFSLGEEDLFFGRTPAPHVTCWSDDQITALANATVSFTASDSSVTLPTPVGCVSLVGIPCYAEYIVVLRSAEMRIQSDKLSIEFTSRIVLDGSLDGYHGGGGGGGGGGSYDGGSYDGGYHGGGGNSYSGSGGSDDTTWHYYAGGATGAGGICAGAGAYARSKRRRQAAAVAAVARGTAGFGAAAAVRGAASRSAVPAVYRATPAVVAPVRPAAAAGPTFNANEESAGFDRV
jgi:hypothetical protein